MTIDVQTSLDLGGVRKILNVPTPTAAGDAVPKAYVDSAIEGLSWKDNCRVATQVNLNLASPGATIDGITMAGSDRVLVRSQSAPAENGIYIWSGSAVPMTRALDANTAEELEQAITTVEEGTSGGASYRQTSINFTLGSAGVAWVSFGAGAGAATETSAGIAEVATQAETNAGTDDARFVTPQKLAGYTGMLKRMSQPIGDGSATSFTITHNFNSRDVNVEVYRNSGNFDTVLAEVRRPSANAVQVVFDAAPASDAFQVVVKY